MIQDSIKWQTLRFEQLTTMQLYQLLSLRVAVFVVEQNCSYQELDGKDLDSQTHHVIGYLNDDIIAYTRVLAPNVSYDDYASIGRVIVAAKCRGTNVSTQLMKKSILLIDKLWPDAPTKISAQEPLEQFYNQFGFKRSSNMYLEDEIPHISMIMKK